MAAIFSWTVWNSRVCCHCDQSRETIHLPGTLGVNRGRKTAAESATGLVGKVTGTHQVSATHIIREKHMAANGRTLTIVRAWCKACGICVTICPKQVLGTEEVTNRVVIQAPERCTGCGRCEIVCPDFVFSIEE
jgi:2-oxoglutarate ferredoxin oxidoreductase subunit delta